MIGIALVFALFGQRPPEPRPTMRFTIALPDDMAIDPLRGSVAVSADGTRMVYVALLGGRPRLLLRTIDRDVPQVIDGSDGAADPFFSADGRWIGFFAHGSLKKLSVDGGTPVVLCAARAGAGASWGRDGTIVFGGGPGGGLARVSEDGGEPIVLTAPPAGSRDVTYGWPDVLPDGSAVLYTAVSLSNSRVALYDIATATSVPVIDVGAFARYSPTGHLVFERRGRLEAAAFSLSRSAHHRRPAAHSSRARDERTDAGGTALRVLADGIADLRPWRVRRRGRAVAVARRARSDSSPCRCRARRLAPWMSRPICSNSP